MNDFSLPLDENRVSAEDLPVPATEFTCEFCEDKRFHDDCDGSYQELLIVIHNMIFEGDIHDALILLCMCQPGRMRREEISKKINKLLGTINGVSLSTVARKKRLLYEKFPGLKSLTSSNYFTDTGENA